MSNFLFKYIRLICALSLLLSIQQINATSVTLYNSFAGNLNFVTGGGTMRTGADGSGGQCNTTTGPVNGTISTIPSGATIEAAYLYWAGSGVTADLNVTFNGTNVTADRSFSEVFNYPPDYDYFGGFKDVTSLVTGNGTYSFSNLTVDTGSPWCGSSAVLAGWALVVIFSHPSEDFRVVNVYDGLQQFRGSSITLTPSNFKIPSSPINGRFAVVSWEGDVGNSASLSGFNENITFNGNALTDTANPTNNQFNSTINKYGTSNNYYGVDIDSYDVDSFLSAGQTSATSVYSSGGDLVLLNAQVISVTNTPVSDLAISKTHSGDFSVNNNGVYTMNVTNNGPLATSGTITVTDTLPTGLGFVSATGSGWSCSFSTPTVTCTRPSPLANGATSPDITLTVSVDNAAFPSVTNSATVSGVNFDNDSGNDTASDPTTVLGPDLSSSTKDYNDINGGEVDVGDTIQYTITLNNTSTTAAASGVSVTDNIPANITGFSVQSIPAGATNSSTGGGTGANGTGYLNITNISVPASGSATITFNVTIAGTANPGDTIDNTATITVPVGTGGTADAPTITVSPSQIPTVGTKDIYIANSGGNSLTRVIPVATSSTTINGGGNSQSYILNPVLAADLTLAAGTIPITLRLTKAGGSTTRTVRVDLDYSNGAGGWIAIGNQQKNITISTNGTYETETFSITLGSDVTIPAGRDLRFRLTNNTTQTKRRIIIRALDGGVLSQLQPTVNTVINVDSIDTYSATYPAVTTATDYAQGETAYIRAVVSDPFGSADITSAAITIKTPAGTSLVSSAAMTSKATTALTRTYEYAYTIPTSPLGGNWEVTVVAKEGAENTISDDLIGAFPVAQAIMTIVKSSSIISDFISGSNYKRIPGSLIEYSILATNTGRGSPNANTVSIKDVIPTNMVMCVSATCAGGNPVTFTQGTPTSGLSFTYPTNIGYSNQVGGGAPYTYTPVPDVDGYDLNVKGFQVSPSGTMNASSGTPPDPNFTIKFKAKVK
ncbi:MAG: hypothetical protein R3A80_10770 [Bdellovibrionota bacterium]